MTVSDTPAGPDPLVAASVDALTPGWLNDALSPHLPAGSRITGVEVEQIGVGAGFVGYIYRLRLDVEPAGTRFPETLVVKLPGDPGVRFLADLLRFFEKETRFYQEAADSTPVATPAVLYAAFDSTTNDFTLVMEDLASLRLVDQLSPCPPSDAETVVRTLGQVHAAWWASERLEQLTWLPTIDDPGVTQTVVGAFEGSWEVFLSRWGADVPPAMQEAGPRYPAALPNIMKSLSLEPRTLVHGDYRLDNLFFAATPDDPPLTVADWQIVVAGRGPYDLAYFVAHSLSAKDRVQFGDELVRLYHRTLVENGVGGYDLEACLYDYRLAALFCFVYPVIGGATLEEGNERGERLHREILRRSTTTILDLGALDLLDAMS